MNKETLRENIKSVRGMNDILPTNTRQWRCVENTLIDTVSKYGYEEIRFPIIEFEALFNRAIGEPTDIVEKEMYIFKDRNDDLLCLRPEGTAGCVRAGIEHGLLYNKIQKLWYTGAMFRHERPQKGRFRQFHQFGVEIFGLDGPCADAEILIIGDRMFKSFGISKKVILQINTLGNAESRTKYKKALVEYFSNNLDVLDEQSKKRLTTNPLRILDSKNPDLYDLIAGAPNIISFLDDISMNKFLTLQKLLTENEISFEINNKIVRGLDYYSGLVFEWITTEIGQTQNAVCAGGRYDNLVAELGGPNTPACGFAIGLERLVELACSSAVDDTKKINTHVASKVYVISLGEEAQKVSLKLSEEMRELFTNAVVITGHSQAKLSTQLKHAANCGADFAVIIGENELANGTVMVRKIRRQEPEIDKNEK